MYKNFSDYRKAWGHAYVVDPVVPLNIDLELAAVCDLACPFCFWGEAEFSAEMKKFANDGKPKKRLMPTDMALQIISDAAMMGVPALKMNWRGESTLHPDYSQILRYARSKNVFHDILVNTNANCKDRAIDGLMAATKCMISLDSTIPEIYAKMRVNGKLERAIEVGKELIRRGHPNLWIRRVVTKENVRETFAVRCREIFGETGFKVSEHHCVDRSTDSKHQMDNPDLYERTYCGYPSQRIMVAADGTAYPCCVDYDGTMPIGNFAKDTLLEIWNGERMVQLRNELRHNIFISETCKKCTSWMSYAAPQRENVQDKAIEMEIKTNV